MKTDTSKVRQYAQNQKHYQNDKIRTRGVKNDKPLVETGDNKIFKNRNIDSIIDNEIPSFEEILNDNTKEFSSKKRGMKVKIQSKLSQNEGITFGDDTHSILMIPITDKSNGVTAKRKYKAKDEIVFNSFKGEDDLEYQVTEKGLKENIVINQIQDNYIYEFELKLDNLDLTSEENKISFKDKSTGEILYKFSDLFMQDSAEQISYDISLSAEKKNDDTWKLRVLPNAQWLNSNERQFPVKVDPSIETCQEEFMELTWKNVTGSNVTIVEDKGVVGVKDGRLTYLDISLDLSPILQELKNRFLLAYRCVLELYYDNGTRPASTPGFCVIDRNYSSIYLQDSLEEDEGKLVIDFTSFVKNAVSNNLKKLDLLLYLKGAWGSSQALEGAEFDPSVDDFIHVYHDKASDENHRPHVSLEYRDLNEPGADEKTYDLGLGGTTFVNLKRGKHRHEIFDATISHNSLSLDLKHVYRTTSDNNGLGYGWKTNLHQEIVKDPNYNSLAGSKDIIYTDGEGFSHILRERWYYEVNEVKHYVKKENVYLDTDQKLKYKNNTTVYEVKYEVANDEGLSFISGSSLANYKDKAKYKRKKKFSIPLFSGKIELIEDPSKEGRYTFPIYAYSSLVKVEENSLPEWIKHLYPTKEEAYRQNILPYRELIKAADGSISDRNGVDVSYVRNLYGAVTINKTGGYEIRALSRVYYGENNNSDPLIESFENDGIMIKLSYEDVLVEDTSVEGDYFVNDELKQINDQLVALNDNLVNLKLNLRSSSNGITSALDDIKLKELTYNSISDSGSIESGTNKYLISHGVSNAKDQKSISIDSFTYLEKNIWDIETKIVNLKAQKQAMINNQKKKPNDFIIDKDGNIFGFNGYGRLVLIQDKYENEIRIVFDDKTINSNRITAVESDTQRIKFNYENDRLKSIRDTKGRLIKYSYDKDMKYLVKIILPSSQKITLSNTSSSFIVNNQLDQRLAVNYTNTILSSVIMDYDGQKKQLVDGILRQQRVVHINDNFTFSSYIATIRDKNQKVTSYYLDIQGRIKESYNEKTKFRTFTKFSGKKSEFNIDCKTTQPVKAFGVTGVSKTINKEFIIIDNGTAGANQILRTALPDDQMMSFIIGLNDFSVNNLNIVRVEGKIEVIDENDNAKVYKYVYDEIDSCNVSFPFVFDKKTIKSFKFTFSSSVDLSISNVQSPINLLPCTGQIMKFDRDDKVIEIADGLKHIFYDAYDGTNPSEMKVIENGITKSLKLVYSETGKITYQEDSLGNCLENYYDEKDQLVEKRTYNKKDPSLCKVEKTSYDEKGNAVSIDGALSNQKGEYPNTEVTYLPGTKIASKIKSPDGQVMTYTYDYETEELLSISSSADGQNNATVFTYNLGLLASMMHHGFGFEYEYDGLGRRKSVKIKGDSANYITTTYNDDYVNQPLGISYGQYVKNVYANELITETFTDEKGLVKKSTIDGKATLYTYDTLDRLTQKVYDGGKEKEIHSYNTYGNISSTIKSKNNIEELKVENTYDDVNPTILSCQAVTLNDSVKYYLNYDVDSLNDNQIKAVSLKTGTVGSSTIGSEIERVDYEYDAIGRVVKQELKKNSVEVLCDEYEYLKDGDNTLDLIRGHHTKLNGTLKDSVSYDYDVAGNIIRIITDEDQTRYQYDKLNRLIREDNPKIGCSITYKYDQAGNILLKKTYAYSLDDNLFSPQKDVFTYACTGWKDQLTSFNGETFIYDNMGRPTTFRNKTLVWSKEGTLQSFNNTSYTYNGDGIRISKTQEGVTEKYVLDGTKILRRKITSSSGTKDFIYRYGIDKLIGFSYNNIEYIYQRNIQGDITHIYTIAGQLVAKYVYDAYGNHMVLTSTGLEDNDVNSIGNLNPFRYRGYYFDTETELYYLNARYYDPELGRFISPDILSILDETRGQINGLNLYMYCGDNPVMRVDPSGFEWWEFWKWDWAKIGAFVVSAATTAIGVALIITGVGSFIGVGLIATGVGSLINGFINESNGGTFFGGWLGGIASGLLSTFVPGIGSFIGAFTGSIITDRLDGKEIDLEKAFWSAAIAGALSMFPSIVGSFAKEIGKDIALYMTTAYNSLLLSICGSIINVFWRGKNDEKK